MKKEHMLKNTGQKQHPQKYPEVDPVYRQRPAARSCPIMSEKERLKKEVAYNTNSGKQLREEQHDHDTDA